MHFISKFKIEIKILVIFLTVAFGVLVEAQLLSMQLKSSTTSRKNLPQITTVNPTDPVNDTRRMNDSQMLLMKRQKRTMVPNMVSATTKTFPTY